MGKYLDGVEWYEKEELGPRLRVSVNMASLSGRLSLNGRFMEIVPSKFVQVGYNAKRADLMVEKIVNGKKKKVCPIVLAFRDEPGDNVHSIITTERSKVGSINLSGLANEFAKLNLTGLYRIEYIVEEDVFVTAEFLED